MNNGMRKVVTGLAFIVATACAGQTSPAPGPSPALLSPTPTPLAGESGQYTFFDELTTWQNVNLDGHNVIYKVTSKNADPAYCKHSLESRDWIQANVTGHYKLDTFAMSDYGCDGSVNVLTDFFIDSGTFRKPDNEWMFQRADSLMHIVTDAVGKSKSSPINAEIRYNQ